MKMALILNFSFACVELVGGLWTNSVAILSDALHDFGDALALGLAIGLEKISHKKSDAQFSYGYRRFSILGAVITGLILMLGSVFILIEAVPRLLHPQQPHADGMIALALLGLVVNGAAAYRVSQGLSLNERMLMWHMLEDVLGWALVLVGALVMKFFDFPQLDAGLAILLALWILFNVFKNLREVVQVFLMATPSHTDLATVEQALLKIENVVGVHHAHLWSLDGQSHVLTAHIVLAAHCKMEDVEQVKMLIKKRVQEFGIVEATLETELAGTACADPDHQ